MQLPLQRLELRFDEPHLELRGIDGAPIRFPPELERVREADQEQIRHEHPIELRQILDARRKPPAFRKETVHQQGSCSQHGCGMNQRIRQGAGEVHRGKNGQAAAADLVCGGESDDDRRQERRDVPVDQVQH